MVNTKTYNNKRAGRRAEQVEVNNKINTCLCIRKQTKTTYESKIKPYERRRACKDTARRRAGRRAEQVSIGPSSAGVQPKASRTRRIYIYIYIYIYICICIAYIYIYIYIVYIHIYIHVYTHLCIHYTHNCFMT